VSTVFQQVGRYSIQRELGRGGMATVFLATDPATGMDVALKQVAVGFDRDGHEILEAEQWGAELQSHFSEICDAVPKVYDSWQDGDYLYIAMEYVEGINLSEVLAKPLARDRAVQIAIELCRFLEAAHAFTATIGGRTLTSLHHSDLKPRNIRITSSGHVKVLDFGIAKALSLSRKVTRNDFGSVPYLSPERLESNDIDAYSDLWALGVVFYEMLQGRQPFVASDTRQLERRILSRVQPPAISDECPAPLQAIAAKLLAPQIADRYATAAAIRGRNFSLRVREKSRTSLPRLKAISRIPSNFRSKVHSGPTNRSCVSVAAIGSIHSGNGEVGLSIDIRRWRRPCLAR